MKITICRILISICHISFRKSDNEVMSIFFNWDSLHAKLNSHCDSWSCKKKKHKKVNAYRISV